MKQTIAARIWVGYGLIFLVFLASNAFVYRVVDRSGTSSIELKRRGDQALQARGLVKAVVDMETGLRGFLVTADRSFLEPYDAGRAEFATLLGRAREAAGAEDQVTLAALDRVAASELAWRTGTAEPQIRAREAERSVVPDAETMLRNKAEMDDIRRETDKLVETSLGRRESVAAEVRNNASLAKTVVPVGTLLALLLAGVVGGLTIRDTRRRLGSAIYSTTSATSQIAATVQEQERTVVQLASAINEVTATAAELNATSQRSAEGADAIAEASHVALDVARAGARAVADTATEMLRIKEKVEAVSAQVLGLSEQNARVGSLAALMGDFANQTNLLALNAAVEAARAGEHGRGLSVVAGEIRRLADQSRQATERTREIVAEIQRATNQTVMVTEEGAKRVDDAARTAEAAGESIRTLESTFERTVTDVQQIAETAREQATATEQVTIAMGDIDRTMQQIVAATSQTGRVSDTLDSTATALRTLVD